MDRNPRPDDTKRTMEPKPGSDESPTEKLDQSSRPASPVPGAENPESKEIKEEKGPNTE